MGEDTQAQSDAGGGSQYGVDAGLVRRLTVVEGWPADYGRQLLVAFLTDLNVTERLVCCELQRGSLDYEPTPFTNEELVRRFISRLKSQPDGGADAG